MSETKVNRFGTNYEITKRYFYLSLQPKVLKIETINTITKIINV